MTGTSTWATISGTAAAAASLFTVTRTSSLPAACSARTCAAVAAGSAVSVLVIDWTTIGWAPPTFTPPTSTTAACRRWRGVTRAIYEGGAAAPAARSPVLAQNSFGFITTVSSKDETVSFPANGPAPVFEAVTATRAHTESLLKSELALERRRQLEGRGGQAIVSTTVAGPGPTGLAGTLSTRFAGRRVPAESAARYSLNASVPLPTESRRFAVPEMMTESTIEEPAPRKRSNCGALDVSMLPGSGTT